MLIETERLLLREYTLADYDTLFEIVSDAALFFPSPTINQVSSPEPDTYYLLP